MSHSSRALFKWTTAICHVLIALTPSAMQAEVLYDGIILGRAGRYDGYPSHLFYGGKHHVWWCSQGSSGYDTIYTSTKTGSLGAGGWSTPTRVFTEQDSPWGVRHTCDPSVIRGMFSYQGDSYTLAMYYTSWKSLACPPGTTCPGGRNAVGVAFSNDGLSWLSYPAPVASGNEDVITDYGAGQSGVAFDPATGWLMHAYRDTSANPSFRLNQTADGIQFVPEPSYSLSLGEAARNGFAQAPDIAYNPSDGHWYAVIKNTDAEGTGDGETRVLRARLPQTLMGPWEVIGVFNSSLTGWKQNQNPGLGKNGNGSLYVDAQGWAYVFFTVGNVRPDVDSWEVAQGRFRPAAGNKFFTVTPCRILDTRTSGAGAFSAQSSAQLLQISGACGIPFGAVAVAMNLTGVPGVGRCGLGFTPGDVVSAGPTIITADQASGPRAVFSVLGLSRGGEGTLYARASCAAGGSSDLVIDVTGYFLN